MESIGVGDLEAKIYSSGVERNRQILRPDQIVRFMRIVTSPAWRGDRRVLLSAITVMIGRSRQAFYEARDGRVSADMALVLTPLHQGFRARRTQVPPVEPAQQRAEPLGD